MSTSNHSRDLDAALSGIQVKYRSKITAAYLDLKKNHLEARIDAAGLAAGKFCEAVLRHLQSVVAGTSTPFNRRIPNFADACRKLITSPAGNASESERIVIPRALVFAYTMRNERGIGHVGGDVDANRIDLAVLSAVADWVVCELIRLYHGLSLEEAQDLVDGISIRRLPTIWEGRGSKTSPPRWLTRQGIKFSLSSTHQRTAFLLRICLHGLSIGEWTTLSRRS